MVTVGHHGFLFYAPDARRLKFLSQTLALSIFSMSSRSRSGFFHVLLFNLLWLASHAQTASAISDEDCANLGRSIASDLSTGKSDEAVKLLDQFAFADRVIAGLGMNDKDAGEFRLGMFSKLSEGLARELKSYSSARYLRVQKINSEKRVLIRCVNEAGAVNYLAFVAGRREGRSVRWVDIFTYLSGELVSETTHRAILPMITEGRKNALERLTSKESAYVQHFSKIAQGLQLIRTAKYAEALAQFAQLPTSLQRERFVLVMRLRAAQNVGDAEYLKVITDWEQAYPEDPALDLVSIDGDILRKDYAKAIKHVDALNKELGGDAYLTYLKGNIYFIAGTYPSAAACAREVLAAEPTLTSAWDILLNSSIREKKYDETAGILEEFAEKHPRANIKKIVDETESYGGFRASPEYAKWAATLEKK